MLRLLDPYLSTPLVARWYYGLAILFCAIAAVCASAELLVPSQAKSEGSIWAILGASTCYTVVGLNSKLKVGAAPFKMTPFWRVLVLTWIAVSFGLFLWGIVEMLRHPTDKSP